MFKVIFENNEKIAFDGKNVQTFSEGETYFLTEGDANFIKGNKGIKAKITKAKANELPKPAAEKASGLSEDEVAAIKAEAASEVEATLNDLESAVTEKEVEIEELSAKLVETEAALNEANTKIAEQEEEIKILSEEIEKASKAS